MSTQSPLDVLREPLALHLSMAASGEQPTARSLKSLDDGLAALAQVQTLVDAAHHYLNGTDPDGYINLREALAPFAGDGNEWAT